MRYVVKIARQATIAALFIVAALLGTLSGVVFAYADDLPLISALDDYSPHTITRVLGRDGAVVGDFAVERRVVVTYQQIPEVLRNAIVVGRRRRVLRPRRAEHLAHGAGARCATSSRRARRRAAAR